MTSTLENDVLIPKCSLLHNSTSQRGFQLKDGLRVIWNRVQQMDGTIIDLVLGCRGGTPKKLHPSHITSHCHWSCEVPSSSFFLSKSGRITTAHKDEEDDASVRAFSVFPEFYCWNLAGMDIFFCYI